MMVNKGNIPKCQNGHGESSKVRISALVMMCSLSPFWAGGCIQVKGTATAIFRLMNLMNQFNSVRYNGLVCVNVCIF